MGGVELGNVVPKEIEKSAQNNQKTSVITQIGNTVNVLDSIIEELRSSQNGDSQDNAIANQLISSLTEIRGNTLRRNPVIVWQNPRILLPDKPVINEPVRTTDKTVPVARKKTAARRFPNGQKVSSPKEETVKPTTISEFAVKPPEGFMTVAQVCKILGISEKSWRKNSYYTYKKKYDLISFKIGGITFYKEEDIEAIAQDRQQRVESRLNRKPRLDQESEEYMGRDEEESSQDLDPVGLHLKEVGRIPMEIKNHRKWSTKILISQLAANMLSEILKHGNLTPEQQKQISEILEDNVVMIILNEFQNRLSKVLLKKMLGSVIQKISNKQKLDSADEFFINSVQSQANWIIDKLSNISRIRDSEKRESEIQKLIDRQIYLIDEGVNARSKLTETNLRLVFSIAKKYAWSGLTLLELVSYGDEGLMKAAVKFDWRRGKFSTYATWWIRQSITRAIEDHSGIIRVPVHMYERISKFKKAADKLLQKGEDIDYEDLANQVDPTGNLAKSLRTRNLVSLNSAVGPDQGSFLEDFLEDVRNNIEENSDKIGLREALMEALDTLTPREKKVLMFRYGLEDGVSRSLDHVSAYLEKEGFARVTRERIRQIESKALRKLRSRSISKKLRPYFDDDPKALIVHPGEAAHVGRKSRKPQKNPIARVFLGRSIARSPAF